MRFKALVVDEAGDDLELSVRELSLDDLPAGEVLVRVHYSSANYKDGLAVIKNGNVVRSYPMIPGIDLAGVVETSEDERFSPGQEVIVTSYDLGTSHFGGYSEYARVPADWVVPLPDGLSLQQAMALGTAGFTAALAIQRMEDNGLEPSQGPVLVTGASGGVGSLAIDMLSGAGYTVAASTGTASAHELLRQLGASDILSRDEVRKQGGRPLEHSRWSGAVDPVGGDTLAYLLASLKPHGSAAVMGMVGGNQFESSVFPFILRGINLLGVDSAYCPMPLRRKVWERLATDLKPRHLDRLASVYSFEELPQVLESILDGAVTGRSVIAVKEAE